MLSDFVISKLSGFELIAWCLRAKKSFCEFAIPSLHEVPNVRPLRAIEIARRESLYSILGSSIFCKPKALWGDQMRDKGMSYRVSVLKDFEGRASELQS